MNSYIWIHIFMNSYMNSESIHLNSYTWIHILMNSYIHFIYEFRCIWIHIIISYMNSYNDYMNLYYVYEFIYMNSYMNSYKLWIHMIFSYMNSYVLWIHLWIRVYQGSRWGAAAQGTCQSYDLDWLQAWLGVVVQVLLFWRCSNTPTVCDWGPQLAAQAGPGKGHRNNSKCSTSELKVFSCYAAAMMFALM